LRGRSDFFSSHTNKEEIRHLLDTNGFGLHSKWLNYGINKESDSGIGLGQEQGAQDIL
jgi:hypothetical protein